MKRSRVLSLALLVGAGAGALVLARLDPSQDEEDVLVYRTEDECVAAAARSAADCHAAYAAAAVANSRTAPRYEDQATCEAHHGAGDCYPASRLDPADTSGRFVPFMAAFMVGTAAAQRLVPQPLYDHRPEAEREEDQGTGGSQYGGYCTASGGHLVRAVSGGSRVTASRSVTRTTSSSPRVVARGGFGFSGHAHARGGGSARG